MNTDEVSQHERRKLIEERRVRAATYHSVAMAGVDDERGGRYANADSRASVIGASPIAYPAQPEGSPWHRDPCGTEPPLGYSVDEQEPVGEVFERASTTAAPQVEEPPSPPVHVITSGGDVRQPSTFKRR
jgi:hypothetical protein